MGKEMRPICPDCKSVMVKTHLEKEEDDRSKFWLTAWMCECKYEGQNVPV